MGLKISVNILFESISVNTIYVYICETIVIIRFEKKEKKLIKIKKIGEKVQKIEEINF